MLGQLSFLWQSVEPPGRTWPRRTGCCKGTLQEGHDLVGLDVAKGPSTRRLLGLCWKTIMTPRSTPKSSLHHDRQCCHTMGLVIMPFVIQILHVLVVDLIRSPRRRTSTMPRPRQERAMLFDERRTLEMVTVSSHFMDILHVVFWWLYSNLSSEGHDVEYLAIVSGDLGYLFLGMVNSKGFTFNIIILNFI